MLTLAAFIVALLVVISIHEFGHYVMALFWRVKVLQFSIGFGPPVLTWQRKQPGLSSMTEFRISALPFGGFVKMHAAQADGAFNDPQDAFESKSLLARSSIVLAGPLINLLLAVSIYALLNWTGSDKPLPILSSPKVTSPAAESGIRSGDQVLRVRGGNQEWQGVHSMEQLQWAAWAISQESRSIELEVKNVDGGDLRTVALPWSSDHPRHDLNQLASIGIHGPRRDAVIHQVVPGGPASQAGLLPGDLVLSVDGEAIKDAFHLTQKIRSASAVQAWEIQRPGPVLLQLSVLPRLSTAGGVSTPKIDAFLGSSPVVDWMRDDFGAAWKKALLTVYSQTSLTLQAFLSMFTSDDGWKQINGPLSIAEGAGKTAETGWQQYLSFIALLSLSVGVLNLLPIPMLDGGHLMYYLWEGIRGKPPSIIWQERLRVLGIGIIFSLIFLALFNDFLRLFR